MEFFATFISTLLLLMPLFLIVLSVILIIYAIKSRIDQQREYKESTYHQITKLPYSSVRNDKGRYGEFLIYNSLKKMEANGAKFLFNVYLPKENGETTEIDVLMICSKGIFVFESKNYSGWIFGSEHHKNWHQTLRGRRGRSQKEHFYNPIMQNRSHMKHLKEFIGGQPPMHSVIVFSNRCILKNIQIESTDISVINLQKVVSTVSDICNQTSTDLLSEADISNIHDKLYSLTQVDNAVKVQHIANIQKNKTIQSSNRNLNTNCAKHNEQDADAQQKQEAQEHDSAPMIQTQEEPVHCETVKTDSEPGDP
ncbi:MAG: NERD domain-containing protein, partial [Clostridia bacterium]|nr:NERD domain-containing protein [Clostridia bacterium]